MTEITLSTGGTGTPRRPRTHHKLRICTVPVQAVDRACRTFSKDALTLKCHGRFLRTDTTRDLRFSFVFWTGLSSASLRRL